MVGLRDALRMRGIQIRDHASDTNEIRICCPFCSDTKFRLGINCRTGEAHCFNCDKGSRNIVKQLMKQLNLSPVTTDTQKEEKVKFTEIDWPEGSIMIGQRRHYSRWTEKAYDYLKSRGITKKDMLEKHVLFTEVGKFAYRVVFPVVVEHKVVGLVGRGILKSQKPKYLNTKGQKGIWNIPKRPKEKVILCEGIFKALSLEKLFDQFTVGALLGHSITDLQTQQIKKAKMVCIWPDPDPPGLKGAIKIAFKLRSSSVVLLPTKIPTKQADEMTEEERIEIFKSMKPLSDSLRIKYKFQAIKREREAE